MMSRRTSGVAVAVRAMTGGCCKHCSFVSVGFFARTGGGFGRGVADMDALTAMVEKNPKVNGRKIGVTGMCRGGRTVWMYTAHSKKVKAGVAWYGGLNPSPPAMTKTPHDVAGALNAPVLGLYAGADGGIPVPQVAALQEVLKKGNKNSQASTFILYPNMPHGFHADYRPTYRKEAADDGWKQMLAWFKQNGVA